MNEGLTDAEWQDLYKLSEVYYRRGRYPSEITKKDFRQICAERALKYMHTLPEFKTRQGYISSTVYYAALGCAITNYNVKKSKLPLWRRYRSEVPMLMDFDERLDLSSVDGFNDVEYVETYRSVLKYAKKHLTPLEFEILSSIYNNKTYLCIGIEHNMSEKSVYNTWSLIRHKLRELK